MPRPASPSPTSHLTVVQLEFYFSDSNLPMDKFLMDQVRGYENLPIPLGVIHSFSRMRRFQPYSAVVDAVKESTFLELTDTEEVRRKVPLDKEKFGNSYNDKHVKIFDDQTQPRSIYAKGFGDETEMTQFNIEKFFMQYGTINSVRLRRTYPEKKFKGSVFVEFEDEDTQKSFLALDPKPKFEGKELSIMSKKEYVEMKAKDIADGKIKAQPSRPPHYSANGGPRGRGGFNRGGRRDDRDGRENKAGDGDWKEARDKFQKGRGRGRGGRGGRGDRGDRRGGDRNRERESKSGDKEEKQPPKPRVDARLAAHFHLPGGAYNLLTSPSTGAFRSSRLPRSRRRKSRRRSAPLRTMLPVTMRRRPRPRRPLLDNPTTTHTSSPSVVRQSASSKGAATVEAAVSFFQISFTYRRGSHQVTMMRAPFGGVNGVRGTCLIQQQKMGVFLLTFPTCGFLASFSQVRAV